MAAPPIPPRPYSPPQRTSSLAPPIPPLPPGFNGQQNSQYDYVSAPHFENPLVAPRPQKVNQDIPSNMARTLDENLPPSHQPSQGGQPGPFMNLNPGFAMPGYRGPSPAPPPPPPSGAQWNGWNPVASPPPQSLPYPSPHQNQSPYQSDGPSNSLSPAMAALSFNAPSQPTHPPRAPSVYSTYGPPPKAPSPPRQQGLPSLTIPLPTIASLSAALPSVERSGGDPVVRITWCRDVLYLVDRVQQLASTDTQVGPVQIKDVQLQHLVDFAVPLILQTAGQQNLPSPLPRHIAEALYLRANISASGAYPQYLPINPRGAFRDFETAARNGYASAWFKLGRDYENFNDVPHAKDCFERGVKHGVESCLYRMGMAHLMGQLGLPPKPEIAVPLLQRAATLASIEVPQPAYVYGLLLLNEFSHVSIPPHLFAPLIAPGSSPQAEARKHLERAAYLNFAPAQYKLGHAYEYAQQPFPYDPLLSVQYYSLASQQGETEADMALSKWFLCGAEGCFDKDEALAYTFAEKAARKGLPSAEFAMGYYTEVGVGGLKDIDASRKWYTKASQHGNNDATERLAALSQPSPQALSRQEHDTLTESKLIRSRTQAKQRSDARPDARPSAANATGEGRQIVDVIRKTSSARSPGAVPDRGPAAAPAARPSMPPSQGASPSSQAYLPPASQGYPSPAPSSSMPDAPRPVHPNLATSTGMATPRTNGPRAPPQAHRYTLVDPGSSSAAPAGAPGPRRSESPARQQSPHRPHSARPAPARIPSGGLPQPGGGTDSEAISPPRSKPSKGPATFEEMGFHSQKLEEKECVIM